MLSNNCTDTDWFLEAAEACDAICFSHGRIHFTDDRSKEVLPTQGQAFFYFGDDAASFQRVFRTIGWGAKSQWSFVNPTESKLRV